VCLLKYLKPIFCLPSTRQISGWGTCIGALVESDRVVDCTNKILISAHGSRFRLHPTGHHQHPVFSKCVWDCVAVFLEADDIKKLLRRIDGLALAPWSFGCRRTPTVEFSWVYRSILYVRTSLLVLRSGNLRILFVCRSPSRRLNTCRLPSSPRQMCGTMCFRYVSRNSLEYSVRQSKRD
jgi:hypothetical protein